MLVHFDRNGFGYTLDRETGELLVAEKYDPAVNWATKIDIEKNSKMYGRPLVDEKYAPGSKGELILTPTRWPLWMRSAPPAA